jgi:phage regulator Rha-like protein
MTTRAINTVAGVELAVTPSEARVDSRLIAKQLHNQHKAVMVLIERYADAFRKFGLLPFEMEAVKATGARGTKHQRFALLNEDQAFFLLSLSRNTDHVVQLKAKLIAAFGEARRAAQQRAVEYLPTYHQLHDVVAAKAAGSANQRFVHMNVNKLVNRTCGLEAGQRLVAPMAQQSMLSVAQAIAASAMRRGADHHDGYQRAKQALHALQAAAAIGMGGARGQRP